VNWRIVRRVVAKELRETVRDRRTLVMMLVVPTLLYPAMMILAQQIALVGQRQLRERPAAVAVAGGDSALAAFLRADSALRIVSPDSATIPAVRARAVEAAVVAAPPGDSTGTQEVRVFYDPSNDRSRRAQEIVGDRLQAWGDTLLARRLGGAGLPATFARPLAVADSSVATAQEAGAYTLARFLPFLLIVMTLLGAFYPAIDLAAGEKERGTLETLLTAPVPAGEIVAGKFAAVAAIGLLAAVANLASMMLTFQSGLFQFAREGNVRFSLPWSSALLVLAGLVPLAVLFAALFLGIAVRSQSFKEAQNALTPVQLAATLPLLVISLPGIEFNAVLAAVPVLGLAMAFRELMSGTATLVPTAVAFATTIAYAGLALYFAARAFGREDVLFGSGSGAAGRVPWRERVRAWREGERRVPLPAEALLFLAAVALLYFHVGSRLQVAYGQRGLLASQWLLLGGTAIAFATLGPYDARRTLGLLRPSGRALLGALLIALGGLPIGWAIGWVQMRTGIFRIPPELFGELEKLVLAQSADQFLWLLLVTALTPAICEELVFRGVLLHSFAREMTAARTIGGTALLFGVLHLSSETAIRLLPTAFLGVLMGFVVWRTRSVFASMLMHFVNNGMAVVIVSLPTLRGMVFSAEGEPSWLLVAAAPLALAAGAWLLPGRSAAPDEALNR
jgi:sodium transport system permease protein